MSAIMLDTCGLIWLVNGGCKISEETLKSIEQANVVYVSAATALEVGCKAAIKKLELPMDAEKWYSKALSIHDLVEIPITGKIADYFQPHYRLFTKTRPTELLSLLQF